MFTQFIIALSTFKYKLKNFLVYAGLIFCSSVLANEEKFTNKDFLELPEAHQKFWIQGAMDAMASVAARKSADHGQCINEWYFGDKNAERNGLIIASMKKYPAYVPSVIFIFLTEEACGKYYETPS